MEKTYSKGEMIAGSVLPFMTTKHDETHIKCFEMIKVPIDRIILDKNKGIELCLYFSLKGKVTYNGLTYTKGINEKSFYDLITMYFLYL